MFSVNYATLQMSWKLGVSCSCSGQMWVDRSEADLLSVSLIGRRSAQVLGALFDFQLLADLPADLFALLIQKLLHAWVREIRVLVQTKLLQNRQPTWVALNRCRGNNNGMVRAGEAGEMGHSGKGIKWTRNDVEQSENKPWKYCTTTTKRWGFRLLQMAGYTLQVKHED